MRDGRRVHELQPRRADPTGRSNGVLEFGAREGRAAVLAPGGGAAAVGVDADGLADVQAFPVWPARAARRAVLVGPDDEARPVVSDRVSVMEVPAFPDAVFADSLAARLIRFAAVPRPADSLGVAPAGAPADSL